MRMHGEAKVTKDAKVTDGLGLELAAQAARRGALMPSQVGVSSLKAS